MNPKKICFLLMLGIFLASCKFNCSAGFDSGEPKVKPVTSDDITTLSGATIKNDIEIEVAGVKLSEAYLLDAYENELSENITNLGEKIYLVIKTDTGWVKENNKSFIGAAERILTEKGKVILDAPDIFKDYEAAGLPADKANAISLSARITEADPGVEKFIVQFRIWDKKGTGEIKGKYKFRIRK